MQNSNLYGEPWEPPPPHVVNFHQAISEFEASGIGEYIATDLSNLQHVLDWLIDRLESHPFKNHSVRLFHPDTLEPAVFLFEYRLEDERESSYYITRIVKVMGD